MTKSFVAFLLFIFVVQIATAQADLHVPKRSQFGISLGAIYLKPEIKVSDWEALGIVDQISSVTPQSAPGFELGIMYRHQLNNNFAFRMLGVLAFLESSIDYELPNNEKLTQTREMVTIELPVHMVFENTSRRFPLSAIAGFRYSVDVAQEDDTSLVTTNYRKNDLLYDLGAGIAFNFERFKMKPELIVSGGLLNQSDPESVLLTDRVVDELRNNRFTLRVSFYN